MKKTKYITINTDASHHPERKVGGYAFWIRSDHFKLTGFGAFKSKNIRCCTVCEIMAIGNALQVLLKEKELPTTEFLIINTDSLNAIKYIQERRCDTTRLVYKLWKTVIHRTKSKNNEFRHVKAHTGKQNRRSLVNDWCDKMAKEQMRKQLI